MTSGFRCGTLYTMYVQQIHFNDLIFDEFYSYNNCNVGAIKSFTNSATCIILFYCLLVCYSFGHNEDECVILCNFMYIIYLHALALKLANIIHIGTVTFLIVK